MSSPKSPEATDKVRIHAAEGKWLAWRSSSFHQAATPREWHDELHRWSQQPASIQLHLPVQMQTVGGPILIPQELAMEFGEHLSRSLTTIVAAAVVETGFYLLSREHVKLRQCYDALADEV